MKVVELLHGSVVKPPGRKPSRAVAAWRGALLAVWLAAAATPAAGEVVVVVRAADGPVEQALVVLKPPGPIDRTNVELHQRLLTDPQGRAVFQDVEPGSYTSRSRGFPRGCCRRRRIPSLRRR